MPGTASTALMLFRNPQDTGYLIKANVNYPSLFSGNTPFVLTADTLKPEHSLLSASMICGNYDVDLIYYAVGE